MISPTPVPRSRALPLLAGGSTVLVGLLNVVSALLPEAHGRVQLLLGVASHAELAAARGIALSLGAALVVAGVQLARGRRGAADAAVLVLVAMATADIVRGLDVEEAAVTGALALALWRIRSAFPVLRPQRLSREALTLGGLGAVTLLTSSFLPLTEGTLVAVGFGAAALWVAAGRCLVRILPGGDVDPTRVASAVRRNGTDTLSAFKLRRDLQHRFHVSGRALVGQRRLSGALLVAGDPVCAAADLGPALAGARGDARAHGLAFGVVGASEACAAAGRGIGLRALYLGDEAFLCTGPMDLAGGRHKSLRKAVNRIARTHTAEVHEAGLIGTVLRAELDAVAGRWRAGLPDRGFSMAPDVLLDELLPEALVVLARGADGSLGGFLVFVPVLGGRQLSLGAMCRDPGTPNGMSDFLVVRAAALLAGRGVEELSLNFVPFGRWMRAPDGRWERALGALARVGDRWFQVARLERYNAKFDPRWQPRYLLYERAAALPRVALAALIAEGQLQLLDPRGPGLEAGPLAHPAAAI